MFEKEAEERARKLEEKQTLGVYDNDEDLARDEGFNDGEVCGYEQGFQEGAEFGYNKAKEEAVMKLKGVNMFEEEAEERIKEKYSFQSFITREQGKELYQDGAEFGYNKANEWHYVKDGDLPKDEDWKWCVSYRGYCYVAKYEEMFGCWTNQEYSEVMQPYAWKEIVLPKESE